MDENKNLPVAYAPGKSPLILNLMPGLTEIGKIKIGRKGEERTSQSGSKWRVPVKLDHFVVTTLERDKDDNFKVDDNIMKQLGDKPHRIPIRLLFDSIEANFQSRYSCYKGKTLWCSGDGRGAFRLRDVVKLGEPTKQEIICPCGREQPTYKGPEKCKMNGCLSCMIDGADTIGGIWKYRTTGYNSTVGIMSSLSLIRALSGGLLAGLDLDMTVQPKVGTDPDGKSVTIQVVGVVFRGNIQQLQAKTLEIARRDADFRVRLAKVETEVLKMIGVDTELVDHAGDIVGEFHPEEPPAPDLKPPTGIEQPGTPEQPAQPTSPAKARRGRPAKATQAPEAATGPTATPAQQEQATEPEPAPEAPDEQFIQPPEDTAPLFT
jgi:hypothetical protein